MKRVASLYLPDWPIERIVRLEQAARTATPPEATPAPVALDQPAETAQGRGPRGSGWRPGARWAREGDRVSGAGPESDVSERPAGRGTEAVTHPFRPHPFRPMHPDEGGAVVMDARALHADHLSRPGKASGEQRTAPPGPGRAVVERPIRPMPPHLAALTMTGKQDAPAPLVTSVQDGGKHVIAAACPAARALGLAPGMAITQARALVPGLDIRPADPAGDRAALERLALLAARRWCPAVMPSGTDGLFLDITGSAHLFGGEAAMTRRIVRLLARAGFSARVAVADTAGAAWALARFSDVSICPAAAHVAALAPLPIAALRIEPRAVELLRRLGVDTLAQLAAMPRAPLARRFGGSLIARLDQASGRLPEPLDPVIPQEQVVVAQRFAEPIATAEAIAHWLGILLPRLVTALARAGLGARAIELIADRIDGVPQCLYIGLARPTRDAPHLLRLIVRRIEEIAPGYGIDALALHVRRADPLEPEAFAATLEDTTPAIAPLIDTLANRIGSQALWRAVPIESDVPERSVAATGPLDPPHRAAPRIRMNDIRHLDRSAAPHAWDARWPRPVRLLRRPEPIDDVIALLPDQPPRRFTWRGETHRIVRADGPERIHGEWWKRASEAHSVRDYFRVEDEAGQRFWLFRRGDGERPETGDLSWFMHGSFG